MARKITCTNSDNLSASFTDTFSPWLLEGCEGIYEVKNNVNTSENTLTDGSTHLGSTTRMRNIVLTLRDHPESNHAENRAILYTVFKPKSAGVFIYEEGDLQRQIDYYVESVSIDTVKRARRATISLLCPDPFFVDLMDISVAMSAWVESFEWGHEFSAAGEEFGYRSAERLKTIINDTATDDIGITIEITATGTVTNPSITHVEKAEAMKIGTTAKPFTMGVGDKLIITTHTNNKHVYLDRNGARTKINEYLSEDSEFIQLDFGSNTFGYTADSGDEHMTITITFRYRYLGV